MTTGSLTVLFEDPFWIGLFEMIDQQGLRACKVTFGAEPTDKEVMEFIDKNWHRLQFSQAIEVSAESERAKVNPKRQLREALKLQQEQNKTERKQRSKAEREAEKQRKFDLRQAKKKEKHKGH